MELEEPLDFLSMFPDCVQETTITIKIKLMRFFMGYDKKQKYKFFFLRPGAFRDPVRSSRLQEDNFLRECYFFITGLPNRYTAICGAINLLQACKMSISVKMHLIIFRN